MGNVAYITRSHLTMRMKMPGLANAILGEIDSITRISEQARCHASASTFAERYKVSTRQVQRAVKLLRDKKYIERDFNPKQSSASYRSNLPLADKRGLVVTAMFLYEREFTLHYENYEIKRRLTRIEVDVLSLMAQHIKFEGSMRQIANMCSCSLPSVCAAVDALLHANLITRSGDEKSKSRQGKSTYHVVKELRLEIAALRRKAKKEKEGNAGTAQASPIASVNTPKSNPNVPKYVQDANARADRERYYALLREGALKKAEGAREALLAVPEYKSAHVKYQKSDIELVKLDIAGNKKGERRLRKERQEWFAIMKKVMDDLGITNADLTPQYKCRRCKDTGYRRDGTACSCYPKGGGE